MSDVIIVAIIVSLPPTLAVGVSWWAQRKLALQQERVVAEKLKEIHGIVNSRLDAALAKIEAQGSEIRTLKEHIMKGIIQ